MNRITPSILAADFLHLSENIQRLEKAGIEKIHLDIMDGNFVPNISFGPMIIEQIRKVTDLHLETHLMIFDPEKWIDRFVDAGSDAIIVHLEATNHPKNCLEKIGRLKIDKGISIKPNTHIDKIKAFLPMLDIVLLMTVFPGFGGQAYLSDSNRRIEKLRKTIDGTPVDLAIDGGINTETIEQAIRAGANRCIAGSAVFRDGDIETNLITLKNLLDSAF
ncbi:MAG: ribulose-phosphate 3-epimerase [Candidatus Marinimicrobia bacterium]|nr:ribulose-phosphate 3-epimerase [Candidatus Neomarinimicrobiota bacterium]